MERGRSNKVDGSFTSGLGAESVVVAATDVSVFGGSLDSGLDTGSDVSVSVFGSGLSSGLDSGSDVSVCVFGGGLSSCTGDDSGDGDGVMVDSPELHAPTTDKDINITVISPFCHCLRRITQ